jgi:P27 family predicted phage terminase small subunit
MGDVQHISNGEKKLRGQNRYIKNIPDTKPISKIWLPPKDLGEAGRKFNLKIGKILVKAKVLAETDKYSWFQLCRLVDHLAKIEIILNTEGYTIGSGDKTKKHPVATLYNELLKQFTSLCAKFGLTPFDKRKINLPVDKNPNDKVREFLFGK